MSRKAAAFIGGLLCFIISGVAAAQSPTLTAGEPVNGVLLPEAQQQSYAFVAASGDVLLIFVHALDPLGDLQFPAVRILDAFGAEIASSIDHVPRFGQTTHQAALSLTIPDDGSYTLIVTRRDDRSTGAYRLLLVKPLLLQAQSPVDAVISSQQAYQFYRVETDSAFQIAYERSGGDYSPEVRVNIPSPLGELLGVGYLAGDDLQRGSIGVSGEEGLYIVSVGWLTSGFLTNTFHPDEVTATYQLRLILPTAASSP